VTVVGIGRLVVRAEVADAAALFFGDSLVVSNLNFRGLFFDPNSLILNGSGAWDRTKDLVINSHPLCR
jgi:hypothetical protein